MELSCFIRNVVTTQCNSAISDSLWYPGGLRLKRWTGRVDDPTRGYSLFPLDFLTDSTCVSTLNLWVDSKGNGAFGRKTSYEVLESVARPGISLGRSPEYMLVCRRHDGG